MTGWATGEASRARVREAIRALIVSSVVLAPVAAWAGDVLLGSTNFGYLVRIDLTANAADLIGVSSTAAGWADIATGPDGRLYAASRWRREPPTVCSAESGGPCAHLYRVCPESGETLQHVGDLQVPFVSDIEFAGDGTLFGNRFVNDATPGGGLVTIEPRTAGTVGAANPHFGSGSTGIALGSGGLAWHPATGELWAVETGVGASPELFRVDVESGLVVGSPRPLGLGGVPLAFGFDSLEILPDGRFLATRGGAFGLYEIDPVADPVSGLLEVTPIPLALDPAIDGKLNGLTALPADPVELVADLAAQIIVLNLRQGIASSLDAKLDAVLNALGDLNSSNDVAAVNSLQAFINAVLAQSGNQILEADAAALIVCAEAIIDRIVGC